MQAAFRLSGCYKFQAYYGAACSVSSNRRRSVEFSPVLHAGTSRPTGLCYTYPRNMGGRAVTKSAAVHFNCPELQRALERDCEGLRASFSTRHLGTSMPSRGRPPHHYRPKGRSAAITCGGYVPMPRNLRLISMVGFHPAGLDA
jgi:hypothetical protein